MMTGITNTVSTIKLRDLIHGLNCAGITEAESDIAVSGLCCDSKAVMPGSVFVAIRGGKFDGHDYLNEAVSRGAVAVVVERPVLTAEHVRRIVVANTRGVLSILADRFFRHPSSEITVIGITGTNGKTTVSFLTRGILTRGGFGVGLVGTISYRIGERVIPATNTTPGPIEIHSFLRQMADRGDRFAVMEVSSHSLDQYRVDRVDFGTAVFTNLAIDHLDYHKTREDYFRVKARLFEGLSPASFAIINNDDPDGRRLAAITRGRVVTYGINCKADIKAENIRGSNGWTRFSAATPGGEFDINTRLIGRHNVYNILAAVSVGFCHGIPSEIIAAGIQDTEGVPGRLQAIDCGQPFAVFVDYAHTEDALRSVLQAMRELTPGKIIVVFGCGGDRDRSKRPAMGMVAVQLADFVILTSDNPRSEDPLSILRDIESGIRGGGGYVIMPDRSQAIGKALLMAQEGDVVLIAGKGHETYQVCRDVTVPFDDSQVVKSVLGDISQRKKKLCLR
jgi:UDP-N-acetylmuramoyl-L-alanyl-D-glutamate--2,6-diaminopimelate ligase